MIPMIRRKIVLGSVVLFVVTGLTGVSGAMADDVKKPDALKTSMDSVVKGIESKATAEQKAALDKLVAAAGTDPAKMREVVADYFAATNPQFKKAAALLADEETKTAIDTLKALRDGSKDEYLRANAGFFLARALVNEDRHEDALPLLEELVDPAKSADKTLYRGEALFLKAVCQNKMLHRDDALKTLGEFLDNYADTASERMLMGAQHMLNEIVLVKDGTIQDVEDRMDFSHRKLALQNSGADTQNEQNKIIAILDKLIKEQEDKENQQGNGNGNGQGGGNQPGQGGQPGDPSGAGQPREHAARSVAPGGSAQMGEQHGIDPGGTDQMALQKKEREQILAALKARYPERYQEMIRQYFKDVRDTEKK